MNRYLMKSTLDSDIKIYADDVNRATLDFNEKYPSELLIMCELINPKPEQDDPLGR